MEYARGCLELVFRTYVYVSAFTEIIMFESKLNRTGSHMHARGSQIQIGQQFGRVPDPKSDSCTKAATSSLFARRGGASPAPAPYLECEAGK